jgi:hypothetical protein
LQTGILILAFISALSVLTFVLTKNKFGFQLSLKPVRLVFLIFTSSGALIIISESAEIDLFLKLRNWPSTEAKIISSRVEGKRAFHPEIIYEYIVAGKTYSGTTDMGVPGFGTKANRLNVAETNVIHNPAGKIITVHYDPNDPSVSRLKILPSYTVFLLLSVGSILFGAGLWGVLAGFLKNKP